MTTTPIWAVWLVSLGTPVLTFVSVLIAQAINRRGVRELETRSKREETMRNLRWAAELSVNDDDRMADLGVAQLVALLASNLLDESEKVFVEAALDAVYEDAEAELDQLGEDAEVVQYIVVDHLELPEDTDVEVSSSSETEEGDERDG